MLLKKIPGDPQTQFYLSTCKYCGKPMIKFQNKTGFCCEDHRKKQIQDNKAKYQRKRRQQIRTGLLISNECRVLGTGSLGEHSYNDWSQEHSAIQKELYRRGLTTINADLNFLK